MREQSKDAIAKLSEITKVLNNRDTNFTVQERYLNKLAKLQRKLIKTNDIHIIKDIVDDLGEFLEPSRVFLLTTDLIKGEVIHEWWNKKEGLEEYPAKEVNMLDPFYQDILKEYTNNRFVHKVVKELPGEFRDYLKDIGVKMKSYSAIPIYSGESIYGVIIITEDLVDERWPETRLTFLNSLQVSLSLYIKGYKDYKTATVRVDNLTHLFDNSLPCLLDNINGVITDANLGFINMLGYTKDEIVGKTWDYFIALDELEKVHMYHTARNQEGIQAPEEFTTKFITKLGKEIIVRVHANLLPDGNVYSNLIDISFCEENLGALKLVNSAMDHIAEKYVITDTTGIVQFCSHGFAARHEYDVSEIIGTNTRILKSGEHDSEFYQNMWETIETGNTWSGEMINLTKTKRLVYTDTTIQPLQYDGVVIGYLGIKK